MSQADLQFSTSEKLFVGPFPGLTKELFSLTQEVPPEWVLTVAINGLRATWYRHKGGLLDEHDRNAAVVAILCCQRALIEGLPRQEGGDGDRGTPGEDLAAEAPEPIKNAVRAPLMTEEEREFLRLFKTLTEEKQELVADMLRAIIIPDKPPEAPPIEA